MLRPQCVQPEVDANFDNLWCHQWWSWCQLCHHYWHQSLSLRQPLMPPVMTKLASPWPLQGSKWWLSWHHGDYVFSVRWVMEFVYVYLTGALFHIYHMFIFPSQPPVTGIIQSVMFLGGVLKVWLWRQNNSISYWIYPWFLLCVVLLWMDLVSCGFRCSADPYSSGLLLIICFDCMGYQ